MRKTFFISVLFLSIPILAVAECKPENTYLTKSSYFGAVNQNSFQEIKATENTHDPKIIEPLLKDKAVIKLPPGAKACVIDINFNGRVKQILISGFDIPYWVADDALIPVR
ncbi:MAG: hypothetical protein NT087_00035 [Deltaproteobacteria bacterium]|nr:hypothetical protein [Deltaproteobacteria bacterium]